MSKLESMFKPKVAVDGEKVSRYYESTFSGVRYLIEDAYFASALASFYLSRDMVSLHNEFSAEEKALAERKLDEFFESEIRPAIEKNRQKTPERAAAEYIGNFGEYERQDLVAARINHASGEISLLRFNYDWVRSKFSGKPEEDPYTPEQYAEIDEQLKVLEGKIEREKQTIKHEGPNTLADRFLAELAGWAMKAQEEGADSTTKSWLKIYINIARYNLALVEKKPKQDREFNKKQIEEIKRRIDRYEKNLPAG